MSNPIPGIFQNLPPASSFPPGSRYHSVGTARMEVPLDRSAIAPDSSRPAAETKTVAYLRRRFVPRPERFDTLAEHFVVQGDRLDNVTAKYLGDPEQFWRLCDANNAMQPDELTEHPGQTVRITLPEGIPAPPHV